MVALLFDTLTRNAQDSIPFLLLLVILFLLYDSTLFLPLSEGCGFLKVILVCFLFSFFFPLLFHGELNPGLLHDRHELHHPAVPQSVA